MRGDMIAGVELVIITLRANITTPTIIRTYEIMIKRKEKSQDIGRNNEEDTFFLLWVNCLQESKEDKMKSEKNIIS